MFAIAALCIAAIVGVWWYGRRKLNEIMAQNESSAESERARLVSGLRTRADVIRAFHLLLRQAAEPVATWWNHRYAANRVTHTSPAIAAAVDELAMAYETARYSPPNIELTPEQLERIQKVLKECQLHR